MSSVGPYQRREKQAFRALQKLPWCLGGRGRRETGWWPPAHRRQPAGHWPGVLAFQRGTEPGSPGGACSVHPGCSQPGGGSGLLQHPWVSEGSSHPREQGEVISNCPCSPGWGLRSAPR